MDTSNESAEIDLASQPPDNRHRRRPASGWLTAVVILLAGIVTGAWGSYFAMRGSPAPSPAAAETPSEPGAASSPTDSPPPSVTPPSQTAQPPVAPAADPMPDFPAKRPETSRDAVEEGEQLIGRINADFPQRADALDIVARIKQWLGKADEAVNYWKKCLELDPAYSFAYQQIGTVAAGRGEQAQALEMYKRALELDPAASEARSGLANTLIDLGKLDEAIEILKRHVVAEPGRYEGYVLLGMAYLQAQKYEQAKESYQNAIRLHPQHANAHFGLATACARLGLTEEAARYRQEFQRLRSEEQVIRSRDRSEYDDATTMREGLAEMYILAARLYAASGRPVAAEKICERAAAIAPKNIEARQALAMMYQQSGRIVEALEMLNQVADLSEPRHVYDLEIARLQASVGQLEPAEQTLRRALDASPQNPEVCAALALFLLQTGRQPEETLRLARTAVELAPVADYYTLLAAACESNGDRLAARAAMARAMSLDPTNAAIRQHYESLSAGP